MVKFFSIAAVLVIVLTACSTSVDTTTTTVPPPSTTLAPRTTTPSTTVPPATSVTTTTTSATTTSVPTRPPGFEDYPGAEYIGAPMPEIDLSATTYRDVAETIEDLDRVWAWMNANPTLVTEELASEFFAGETLSAVVVDAKERAENEQILLSGEGFFGEISNLTPILPGHDLDTALPTTGAAVFVDARRAEPSRLVTAGGVLVGENEGFPEGNVYNLGIAFDGVQWRLAALDFVRAIE